MNIDDLEFCIKNNESCNFIAMAITPLQAVGVDAAISYLKSRGIELNGYVLITSHPDTGRVLTKSSFISHETGIQFVDFEYCHKNKKTLKSEIRYRLSVLNWCKKNNNKSKFYIVWTEMFNNLFYCALPRKSNKDVCFIQIDDGAGTYISNFKGRLGRLLFSKKTIKGKVSAFLNAVYYSVVSSISKKMLEKNGRYISGTIFECNNGKIVRNETFSEYYIKSFKASVHDNNLYKSFENAIVINSQCLAEANITNGMEDLKLYSRLANIMKKYQWSAVIKPHPRELCIDKYCNLGWNVVDTSLPQETIFASIDYMPKCVISIYSSTLLNAYGIYNIPAISLAKIMLKMDINSMLKKTLKRYVRMYKDVLILPKNEEELEKVLKDIMLVN